MAEVTMHGKPLTLVGNELTVGDQAPDFKLIDTDLKQVTLADSKGKVRLISAAMSHDTSVCDAQTTTFNQRAAELGDDVALYAVTVDLPFTNKRFCAANAVDKLTALSDHKDTNFGQAYGLLIEEFRMLGRAVFVIDKNDKVAYKQIVEEVSEEPDYEAALKALKEALGK